MSGTTVIRTSTSRRSTESHSNKRYAFPASPSSTRTARSFSARRKANSTTAPASAPQTSPPSSRSGHRPTKANSAIRQVVPLRLVFDQFPETPVHGGILCASRPCPRRVSRPRLSDKGFNIDDAVYVFVVAQLAASYKRALCVCISVLNVTLQTHNSWGNRNRLSASNTGYCTVALNQFCKHLNLAEGELQGVNRITRLNHVL